MPYALSAVVVRSYATNVSLPLFSYHVTLLREAERTSISPSSSTSMAKTLFAQLAAVEMVRAVNDSLPLFSYQAILLSVYDAERTSISPSSSTSMA